MSERTIKNDLDFAVKYRLVKKQNSKKPFKKLKSHKGAIIPEKDLGNVRLDFRVPKDKDIKTEFRNHIKVFSASSIQSEPDYDVYTYHLMLCELEEEWGFKCKEKGKDEDIELVKPDEGKDF